MVRDHGNPRIAVVLFQDGYRFIGTYASRFHIGILQYHECH